MTWRDALPSGWTVKAQLSRFDVDDERRATVMLEEPGEPIPVLTNITGTNRHGPGWYVAGAAEFLRVATTALRASGRKPLHGRSRFLLALPLLGTKGGGGAAWSGEITSLLLPLLREEAQRLEVEGHDDLFERASAATGRVCVRIPGDPVAPGERFILKMHGCVSRPSSIVLTREDDLRFQENRCALAGIVQALLLTRHMLFVGFGFNDDNFHRIAHAVRSAIRGEGRPGREPFGTNLVVGGGALVADLWREDLDWIALSSYVTAGNDQPRIAEQARLAEIFLDRLSAGAATVSGHLGDDRWAGALDDGARALRERLETFVASATAAERQTLAWRKVEALLSLWG